MGGRSEWTGRVGNRVLPAGVTLVDDPTAKEFQGQPLVGAYEVDEEGARGERVALVENGMLRHLLMSRRPGPDFDESNGHGRSSFLGEPRPAMSNLFFTSGETLSAAELRRKFVEKCREAGRPWCLVVRRMDNPALGVSRQEDFSDMIAGLAAGAASGDRMPLLVYRVSVDDGREELLRGARLIGLNLRALKSLVGVGNDAAVFAFQQSQAAGFGGTALAAFGSAQGGLSSTVVAPSLLLEDVEVRGARGEPRRLPLLPPPPLN
jgi:predicted Zn-dependent protease